MLSRASHLDMLTLILTQSRRVRTSILLDRERRCEFFFFSKSEKFWFLRPFALGCCFFIAAVAPPLFSINISTFHSLEKMPFFFFFFFLLTRVEFFRLLAQRAFEQLNGKSINGKECQISWAQRSGTNNKQSSTGSSLFVKNLPRTVDANGFKAMFEPHGTVLSSELVLDPAGNSRGFGFVHFDSAASADAAKKALDSSLVGSHKLVVEYYVANKRTVPSSAAVAAAAAKEEELNWTNVFFKNTPAIFSQDAVMQLFAPYGVITSAVVSLPATKPEDGVATSFGFVNFETHDQAVAAIQSLNNLELEGRVIYVGRAQKKAEREENLKRLHARRENSGGHYNNHHGGNHRGGYSSGRRGGATAGAQQAPKFQDGLNLFIGNLDDGITEEVLSKEFSRMGTIQSMRLIADTTGSSKGYAFVCFTAQQEAQKAIDEFNNKALPGFEKQLIVRLHEPKKQNSSSSSSGYHHHGSSGSRGGRGGRGGHSHQTKHQVTSSSKQAAAASGATPSATGAASSSAAAAAPAEPAKPTLEILSKLPEDDQKMSIGNYLYFFVSKSEPERAGKITGMILGGHDLKTLQGLMDSEEQLKSKVKEAATLLDSQQ
jgi:RNA recognition motif-containing protein